MESIVDDSASPLVVSIAILSLVVLVVYFTIRPRVGGKNAPPTVLTSPIVKVPILGMPLEFGSSPVKMIQRCFTEYGPIFTIPVRRVEYKNYVSGKNRVSPKNAMRRFSTRD